MTKRGLGDEGRVERYHAPVDTRNSRTSPRWHSVLLVRRGHPRAGKIDQAQLSTFEHVEVQIAPGRGYRGLAQLYASMGIERRVVMTVPSFVAAAAVVAETDFATASSATQHASTWFGAALHIDGQAQASDENADDDRSPPSGLARRHSRVGRTMSPGAVVRRDLLVCRR